MAGGSADFQSESHGIVRKYVQGKCFFLRLFGQKSFTWVKKADKA
jgi:hypothetical protein